MPTEIDIYSFGTDLFQCVLQLRGILVVLIVEYFVCAKVLLDPLHERENLSISMQTTHWCTNLHFIFATCKGNNIASLRFSISIEYKLTLKGNVP